MPPQPRPGPATARPGPPAKAGACGNCPRVREAIEKAGRASARRDPINRDRVLMELARIAFADITDFLRFDGDGISLRPMEELTGEQTACVAEIV